MAKESQEKKKPGRCKRIFKWIGLGLLVLLLLAAIIFQAPWKVITLLVIILAACTALPKPARKWFWLSAGVVVIALIIWIFLPNDNEGWQPYTFDEELATLEAKYAMSDSQNAAIIYNQLLEAYNRDEFFSNLPDNERIKIPIREPWLSKDHPELAEWLRQHQTTITTLTKASKFEKCQFPISLDTKPNSKWMKRLSATRRLAFLLVTAANNDIAEQHVEKYVQKNIALLQMGNHLCQQPTTIDWLVGTAIRALALNQFNRFIITNDPEEGHLREIEEALGNVKYNWSSDLITILEYDKLSTKRSFAKYYEINEKGKIKLSRDPWAQARVRWKQQLETNEIEDQQTRQALESYVYLSYWQKKLIKAKTILLWLYLPSSLEKSAQFIDTIYQNYYEMLEPDFDWANQGREIPTTSQFEFRINRYRAFELLAGLSRKSYYRIHEIHLRANTGTRASKLIIALRRYKNKNGNWPESLDEIKLFTLEEIFVDPISRSSFMYKFTDDNFKLYSKGKNNIDEDGKRDRRGDQKTGADDWLIWPQRSSKTQGKKIDVE